MNPIQWAVKVQIHFFYFVFSCSGELAGPFRILDFFDGISGIQVSHAALENTAIGATNIQCWDFWYLLKIEFLKSSKEHQQAQGAIFHPSLSSVLPTVVHKQLTLNFLWCYSSHKTESCMISTLNLTIFSINGCASNLLVG